MKGRHLFEQLVRQSNHLMTEIMSHRRQGNLVDARQKIAIALKERGLGWSDIARLMDRDHTSIMHLVNKRKERNKP